MTRLFRFVDGSRPAAARLLARLFLSFTLCAALGGLAPNAAPSAAAQVAGAAVAPLVNADGTLNLQSGLSGAVNLQGWNVTLDSQRGPILTPRRGTPLLSQPAGAPSASDHLGGLLGLPQPAPFWVSLPKNGLNGEVLALAVMGSDVYVGGIFNATADGAVTNLNNIARFNTDTNTWSALPHRGLNGAVQVLAVNGSDLYVGGQFQQTADGAVTKLNDIARLSGGAWSGFPHDGLDGSGSVWALAFIGSDLYVGGDFHGTHDFDGAYVFMSNIAKYDGSAWSLLPHNGLDGPVYALTVLGSDLYAGGGFAQSADCGMSPLTCVKDLNGIAKLSGGAWSALAHKGLNHNVFALAVTGSTLYVGGMFTTSFDSAVPNLNHIARLSGGAWSALPDNGLDGLRVDALTFSASDLYVGGDFDQTADGAVMNMNLITHFSTISNTWSAPPHQGLLPGIDVAALAFKGTDLFVGGNFHTTHDLVVTNLNSVAKLTNDTDGDGIPDDWERNGVTINGQFIDLPAMGADPLHKDLFVHADWMNSAGLKPEARDLQIVTDAFNNAPLPNPDGATGVHLHVDLGPDSVMNPVTGATWGALSKAGQLPYQASIGSTAGGAYNWAAVDTIKQTYFNPSERAAVFHYMCFCSSLGGLDATSGMARGIPGHDFLVTLGGWPVPGGTSLEKAGTFMHELGHNLGLHHGGGDDINNKPNYLSVMNYSFQTTGLLTPSGGHVLRSFDYSERQLPTLNEPFQDESAGIADPAGHLTFWNPLQPNNACQTHPNDYFSHLTYPATDWNCDGVSTPITFTVAVDINGDGVCVGPGPDNIGDTAPSGDDVAILNGYITAGPNRKCETTASGDDEQLQPVNFQQPNSLTSFSDWPAVVFDAGNQIGQPPAALAEPNLLAPSDVLTTTVDEPTFQQISRAVPPALFNAEASAPIDVVTYSPASGAAPLHVAFNGSASTSTTGTVTSWVWDFGDSTVGAGATITHTYSTPGTYFATLRVTDNHGFVNLVALDHRVTVSEIARVFLPFIGR